MNQEVNCPTQESGGVIGTAGRRPIILIVDDRAILLRLYCESLEEAGYQVLTAEDGPEGAAILLARQQEIDLVLVNLRELSWIRPSMSGAEWLGHILDTNPKVRVILCTGQFVFDTLYRIAAGKVDGFLKIPCRSTELLAAVERALAGKPQQEAWWPHPKPKQEYRKQLRLIGPPVRPTEPIRNLRHCSGGIYEVNGR